MRKSILIKSTEDLDKNIKQIYIYPNSASGKTMGKLLKKKYRVKYLNSFKSGPGIIKFNNKLKFEKNDLIMIPHDYKKVIRINRPLKICYSYISDISNTFRSLTLKKKFHKKFIINLNYLSDKRSKKIYKLIYKSILKKSIYNFAKFFEKNKNNYIKKFISNLVNTKFKNNDVIDCGCYTGKFIKNFYSTKSNYILFDLFKKKEIKQLTKKKNIKMFKNGLDNKTKVQFFNFRETRSKIHEKKSIYSKKIQTFKLDDFPKKIYPKLIKIDTEGKELNILKGSKKIIKENRPCLFTSIYHGSDQYFTVLNYLVKVLKNYNFYIDINFPDAIDTMLLAIPKEMNFKIKIR